MGFWILALLGAAVAAVLIGYPLVFRRDDEAASGQFDMQVYRDQLSELDRDVERGVIGKDEAERARVEISRRLLDADRKAQASGRSGEAPKALTWSMVALVAALLLGGGAWLYDDMGAPGYWDMPLEGRFAAAETARDNRLSQAEAEADLAPWPGPPADAPEDYIELVTELRRAVETRPDDAEGQALLVTHETALGNYRGAHRAMEQVIALKGGAVTANEYARYADLLALAAEGYVSPEAEAAVHAALARDPEEPVAQYYAGLVHMQTGRPDLTFSIWKNLMESSDPSDPWVAPIRGQIEVLASMAGVDYQLPPLGPGPSAEDMDAAADMTPEEREAMVADMVTRLMNRLATEGGPARDWAQLIQSLGVQGKLEHAQSIYNESLTVFDGFPEDLALLRETAKGAGLEVDGTVVVPVPEAPAAAPEMSDEAVSVLMDRLANEGGPAPDWATLIEALGARGDIGRAQAIYNESLAVFSGWPGDLARLGRAAAAAGLDVSGEAGVPAPTAPGPTADDMEAAAEMSDEERTQMIDGMVTRLSDELATGGGPPEKWIQLLRSLTVLGETDRAAAVWSEAQKAFAGDASGLAQVRAVAVAVGVAE